MVEPTVVPRSEHAISRRDIDPDALKVLYRLHEHNYVAYLVGGSVRDLLLDRRPKDFDIGTSAHPHQVKKLFRNCWIIGRRFRLAHVKFGTKTIEVATFRRQVDPASELTPEAEIAEVDAGRRRRAGRGAASRRQSRRTRDGADRSRLIQRDNTYGTPEEDAFRRDFTVNALFYDIGTFSIIDYVGGLEGSRRAADPLHRRSRRAVPRGSGPHAARGRPRGAARVHDRRADPGRDRGAPPRDRAQRAGAAARGVLQDPAIGPRRRRVPSAARDRPAEGDHAGARGGAARRCGESIAALDRYRARFAAAPDSLTNAILAGTLLQPLGLAGRRQRFSADPLERRVELGMLPIARRDVERLQQILAHAAAAARHRRRRRARSAACCTARVLDEAITWLEIHGERPDVVAHWRQLQARASHPQSPLQQRSGGHGRSGAGAAGADAAARPSRAE